MLTFGIRVCSGKLKTIALILSAGAEGLRALNDLIVPYGYGVVFTRIILSCSIIGRTTKVGRPQAELVLTEQERDQLVRWSRRAKSSQALAARDRPTTTPATA